MKSKNIGWIFITAILFSACQGGIVNTYVDNQQNFLPANDSLRDLANKGYIQIDSSHAGNPQVNTVMLTLKPSYKQKVRLGWHDGTLTVFYILMAFCLVLIVIAILYGSGGGKIKSLPIILSFASVAAAGFACWSIDIAHTKEIPIPKMTYDSLQRIPGAVDQYVDQKLFQ